MLTNSIKQKIIYLTAKLRMIILAEGFKAKMNIFTWAILDSLPRIITHRYSYIKHKIEAIKSKLARGNIISVGGNRFYCIDSASILTLSPMHEKSVWEYMKLPRGGVFIDVGAHIGKYTIPMAKIVGKEGLVIAIEPHPENYLFLIKNIRLSKLRNIIPLNLAAWKEDCELKLFIGESSETHSIKRNVTGHTMNKYINIKAKKLDTIVRDLNLKRVDLVKIDVEGAEVEVLEGMTEILKTYSPKLVIEVFDRNYSKFLEIIHEYEYLVKNIERYEVHGNYFCKPRRKLAGSP